MLETSSRYEGKSEFIVKCVDIWRTPWQQLSDIAALRPHGVVIRYLVVHAVNDEC